jgi:hypothetical protein
MNHRIWILFAMLLVASSVRAETFVSTVAWIETWRNGNVAFGLTTTVGTCNSQFIVNASAPGAKNQYAALLAAKARGVAVHVVTSGCGAADNYNPAISYNIPEYILVQE